MILNSPVAALVRSYTYNDSTAYYTMAEVDISAEERKTLWTLLKFEKVILPDGSSSHFGYGDMNFDEEVSGNDEFVFDALMSKNRPRWSSVSPDHIIEITEENFAVINSIFDKAWQIFPSDSDNGGYYSVSEFTLDYLLLEMNGSLYYYGYDEYPEEANYYYGDDCSEKAKELTIEEILELIQVPSSFGVFTAAYNDGSDGRDYDDDDFRKIIR